MPIRKITKIRGNKVTLTLDDWLMMLRRMKRSLNPDDDQAPLARGGDPCDDFCGVACRDHGGCSFSFGEEPECGAACDDGEVLLQEL